VADVSKAFSTLPSKAFIENAATLAPNLFHRLARFASPCFEVVALPKALFNLAPRTARNGQLSA
jgi:hypothetical protein